MGQYWELIDLDGRTTLSLGKLGESLPYERTTAQFIEYLQIPKRRVSTSSLSKDQIKKWLVLCPFENTAWLRYQSTQVGIVHETVEVATSTPYTLNAFPMELLSLIFDMVPEFADVLCLALASERLFQAGERRIRDVSEPTVPWAGHRLICVSDYLDNEDIPEGLLTPDEQEELGIGFLEDEEDTEEMSLYQLACNEFQPAKSERPRDLPSFFKKFSLGENSFLTRINQDVFKDITHWLGNERNDAHQLILRNVAKKQYVRDEAVSTALGTILLARICWSSDPSCSMAYSGHDLTRGVWAGDRFDIVTLDQLEEMGVEALVTWTDVSKEVNDEMARIWESEFGPDWENRDRR